MSNTLDALVPPEALKQVPNWDSLYDRGYRWLDYQRNACDVSQTLAAADLFWPPLIQVENCVLFNGGAGLQQSLQSLRVLYGSDREIERRYNMQRVIDLVHTETAEQLALANDAILITALGNVLQTLWSLRLRQAFPDRVFHVEFGENIGEEGLAITFYQ